MEEIIISYFTDGPLKNVCQIESEELSLAYFGDGSGSGMQCGVDSENPAYEKMNEQLKIIHQAVLKLSEINKKSV